MQLRTEEGMLIMDTLEIAPHNIGSRNKKFYRVAGCLIAFGCRESLKLEMNNPYKGFLTFTSKSNLISIYQENYGATLAMGQRMYIDDIQGIKLIKNYLET